MWSPKGRGFSSGLERGDRAPQVLNWLQGNSHERERGILNEKSALWTERESCFPSDGCSRNSTLDLDYISKKVRSRRRGSERKRILSFLVDAEPAAPLTKKGAGAAATWTPSFLLPALSRAEPFLKGRQSPKAAIPIGQRAERGGNHTYRGRKSVFPSDSTVGHPRFRWKTNKISISESGFLPVPLMVGESIPLSELGGHSALLKWK